MVMPTTSHPWSCSISAVTVLSIPPLIATKTFPFRLIRQKFSKGQMYAKIAGYHQSFYLLKRVPLPHLPVLDHHVLPRRLILYMNDIGKILHRIHLLDPADRIVVISAPHHPADFLGQTLFPKRQDRIKQIAFVIIEVLTLATGLVKFSQKPLPRLVPFLVLSVAFPHQEIP